jgi:hypothetical protein
MIIRPFEAAGDLLRFYRDASDAFPDELITFPGLLHAPDGSGAPLCGIVVGHTGPDEQAQKDLEPLLSFGSPVDVQVGPMPYTVLNSLIDGAFPKGALSYWKSAFLSELSDAAIDAMTGQFAVCPSPMTMIVLEHFRGAVSRVPVDATAVPHREPGHNLVIAGIWLDPAATEQNIAWTRETFGAMRPFMSGLRYVNYIPDDEPGEDPIRAAYGPNYDRLVELKTKYDPVNLFRLNQNIPPRAF